MLWGRKPSPKKEPTSNFELAITSTHNSTDITLQAHLFKRVEVALVVVQLLGVQVHHVGADIVEKLAIVRDDDQRLFVLLQVVLEPQHGGKVEVILGRGRKRSQRCRIDFQPHKLNFKVQERARAVAKC